MAWPGGDQGQQWGSGNQGPWGGGQVPQDNNWGGQPPQDNNGWYGYAPPPAQGGYGAPSGFPPPPRKSPAGIIAIVVVAVVVLAGAGVGAVVLLSGNGKKHQPAVALSPSAPLGPAPTQSTGPGNPTPPKTKAKISGWNAVVAVSHGVTYDVPPDWSLKTSDTIIGFEDSHGNPQVAGSGAATYKQGYCQGHSGSWRAESAVTGYSTTNPADDAVDAAHKWATDGYAPSSGHLTPQVSVSSARPINVGGAVGQEATATVTVRDHSDPCAPPRGIVHTVAAPAKGGKVAVLIVIADQGVSGAVVDAELQKIAGSLRPTM